MAVMTVCVYHSDCFGGRQLTTFNRQARVLVGAATDKLGKLTRPFHGIIAGLFISAKSKLEEAAQGKPSAKYRPTRVVVDAALRRIRKSRQAVTNLQISPLIVNGFKNRFHQWIQHIFLVVVEDEKLFLFDAL